MTDAATNRLKGGIQDSSMTLRTQVFSALRWTAGARALSQVLTWVITLAVIRLLTPGDYGLLAMAGIFLGLMVTFADAGMGPVLVQRSELGERTLKQVFGVVLVIYFTLACLLVLTAPLIARFFDEPRLVPVIRVLSLQLVLGAFAVIPDAVLQRSFQFRNRSLLDLGTAVVGSLTTLTLALAGTGVWALILGTLTAQALRTIGVNLLTRSLTWPEFSLSGARWLLKVGSQTSTSGVIWFLLVQADIFIAGKWLGKEALGAYSVAMHLASLPNQRISSLIGQVAFPAFSRIQHDIAKVASHTLFGVRALSIFSFPVFWGLSGLAPELVRVLLGPKWGDSILPLQMLSLVMPLRTVNTFVPNAIQGLGRFDVILKNVLVSFVIFVTAFVVGAQWGLVGLCTAWLVSTPFAFFITMKRNMEVLMIPMQSLLYSMAKPACFAFIMSLVIFTCQKTIFASIPDLPKLALGIVTGLLAYTAMTLALNKEGLNELLGLLRELGNRRRSDN